MKLLLLSAVWRDWHCFSDPFLFLNAYHGKIVFLGVDDCSHTPLLSSFFDISFKNSPLNLTVRTFA